MSDTIATLILEDVWQEAWTSELKAQMQYTDLPPEQWRSGGRKTKANPNGNDVEWWIEAGLGMVQAYADWLESSGWTFLEIAGTPLIEADVSGTLGGVEVRGFIDAGMITSDGEAIIVDAKSGAKMPDSHFQLGVYRALLMERFDLTVDLGAYFDLRKGEITEPVELRKYTPEYVGSIFARFKKGLASESFLPNTGQFCFTCDVRAACYAAGGSDAYLYDPDHPQYGGSK